MWNRVRGPFATISSILPTDQSDQQKDQSKGHSTDHANKRSTSCVENLTSMFDSLLLDPGDHKYQYRMTPALAEEIRECLPSRLKIQDVWKLIYSLREDGSSLATLFDFCRASNHSCNERHGYVLFIETTNSEKFGAFSSEYFHPCSRYYSNGECFLWRITEYKSDLAPKFDSYPYSGANSFMIYSNREFLSIGGGSGVFGLWLDKYLVSGSTSSCSTFDNDPLIKTNKSTESPAKNDQEVQSNIYETDNCEKVEFTISQVEVWLVY